MENRPVRIYASEDGPRLRYIAGIIFGDILGLNWEIINDRRKLGKHPVVNYSDENVKEAFKISPAPLLFEKGISEKEIQVEIWNDLPVFFTTSPDSDIPFDLFAASFFLITRYEEYYNHEPDEYGRYKASSSLAFRNGFLQIPIIDLWVKAFAKLLLKKFQTLAFRRNIYKSFVTFDTDEPFEYLGKGIFRSIGGLLRDLTITERNAAERYKTVTRERPDAFEVFGYITDRIEKNNAEAKFFYPVGDRSKYDHNPSWKNDEYRSLILRLNEKFTYGIHPSFNASGNLLILKKEIERLRNITGSDTLLSRFHYIRLKVPLSYNILIMAGIKEDYSMGYPEETGFRAGIARPYCFYDVAEDKPTGLRIVPFQVMDATLYKYKNLDLKSSLETVRRLILETRNVGGLFVSVWHNTSLLDNPEFRIWRELFETMLKEQR